MTPKPLPPDTWADYMSAARFPDDSRSERTWTLAVSLLLLACIAALLYWGIQ